MLTKVLYKAVLMFSACFFFVACSQDDAVSRDAGTTSSVRVLCRLANTEITRADTEDGWNGDWHENTITRLDLFRFSSEGAYKDHYVLTQDDNIPDFTEYLSEYKPLTFEGLTYSSVAESTGDTYYLIANCAGLEGVENISAEDLKKKMATPPLNYGEKQTVFAMDGEGTLAEADKAITLSFDLKRAAVKIRLAVKGASGGNILDKCAYQINNFVESPTSVLEAGEDYGKGDGQTYTSTDAYVEFPLLNDNEDKAVFYSYPNKWFDEGKVGGSAGKWTITDFTSEAPITGDETYILLKAPYGDTEYYYKVPVNYAIYKDNDATSFTDAQLEEIRDLYRIKRNNIYDITVTIDRAGGPITAPVTPMFYVRINDWEKGGDYHITEGEFQEDQEEESKTD